MVAILKRQKFNDAIPSGCRQARRRAQDGQHHADPPRRGDRLRAAAVCARRARARHRGPEGQRRADRVDFARGVGRSRAVDLRRLGGALSKAPQELTRNGAVDLNGMRSGSIGMVQPVNGSPLHRATGASPQSIDWAYCLQPARTLPRDAPHPRGHLVAGRPRHPLPGRALPAEASRSPTARRAVANPTSERAWSG